MKGADDQLMKLATLLPRARWVRAGRGGPPSGRGRGRGEAAAEAALGLLFCVGITLEVAATVSRHPGWIVGAATTMITIGVGAAAMLRRRFPAGAAVIAVALCATAELIDWRTVMHGQPAPVACLALLLIVSSTLRVLTSLTGAVAVAAAAAAVAVGTIERYSAYLSSGAPNAYTATRLMIFGWVIAVTVGVWKRLGDRARNAMIENVRRTERLALARDLHDVAAHHLTALIIQAQVAQVASEEEACATRATLADIEAAGGQALTSLRQVVRLLRDDTAPVAGTLGELIHRFGHTGTRARLHLPAGPVPSTVPPEVTTTVYRIVQEALTNVAQHARGARNVIVTLTHDERLISLSVTDDGSPPSVRRSPAGAGHGLLGMRERVAALGGDLTAGPGPQTGWSIRATIPTPPTA